MSISTARDFLGEAGAALAIDIGGVRFTGEGVLAGPFPMTDLGAACVAASGAAVAGLVPRVGATRRGLTVDRALATGWFHRAARPLRAGAPPSAFHPMSRDFRASDGRWVRFQVNYPHLRAAALAALGTAEDGEQVAAAVAAAPADEVEAAVVAAGGAASASRSLAQWADHPQGLAVATEPLVGVTVTDSAASSAASWEPVGERPLAGLRVLDLTRVLAGPMATRLLAGYGAQVLRIDPPGYEEPHGIGTGDLTLGKRCAVLDLRTGEGRERFLQLLASADVFVHGLRPGALEGLGLGEGVRRTTRPGLVEVTLNAYGWTGPWRDRRGFDTLVQNSTGMAVAGGGWAGVERPYRWPLSILDHATGYLMAAAAVVGVTRRGSTGQGSVSRLSLARVSALLTSAEGQDDERALELPLPGPLDPTVRDSPAGPVRRLRWPLEIDGIPFRWDRPGEPLGASVPRWIG